MEFFHQALMGISFLILKNICGVFNESLLYLFGGRHGSATAPLTKPQSLLFILKVLRVVAMLPSEI